MSTERDELALELFIGDNANQPRESSIQDWTWMRVTGKQQGSVEHYKAMAAHALAAGYRKPRQVTTVEELDALPVGSVLRTYEDGAWEKASDPDDDDSITFWLQAGNRRWNSIRDVPLPATVLHVGGAE